MDSLYTQQEEPNSDVAYYKEHSPESLKKKKIKKILFMVGVMFAFALGLLITFLVLKKMTPGVPGKWPITKITYWGFESAEVMNPLIAKYESEHSDVDITYEERNYEDDFASYKETLKQRLMQGNGPGIYRMHVTWGTSFYPEMAKNNTDKTYDDFGKRFYKVATDKCLSANGDIYCLPLMYDGLALAYNKDLFFNNGLTPPKTWDDLLSSAKRITKYNSVEPGIIDVGGVALGTTDNVQNATDILGLMFAQSKIAFPDSLDTEGAQKVIEYYKSFADIEKVWNSSMPNSLAAFSGQKLGMVFVRQKDIEEILNLNPTINMGVVPVPQIPTYEGGVTTETWGTFWVEAVSNDLSSEDQKKAWEFLWWLSEQDQQTEKYTKGAELGMFGELPANLNLYQNFSKLNYVGPILEQAPDAVTSIISDNSGNDPYVEAVKSVVNLTGGQRDLPEALIELKTKIDELNKGKTESTK